MSISSNMAENASFSLTSFVCEMSEFRDYLSLHALEQASLFAS